MPLRDGFKLYLNSEEIASSKETYDIAIEFDIKDLPENV